MMVPAVPVPYAAEILALREAIASGNTRISYDGKSVEFDDLDGLKRRLNLVLGYQTQALTGQPRRTMQAGFATFSRGTYGR